MAHSNARDLAARLANKLRASDLVPSDLPLESGKEYRDEVGGVYVYFNEPEGEEYIYIFLYPPKPALAKTAVYATDPRFTAMKANLERIALGGAPSAPASAPAPSFSAPAPAPSLSPAAAPQLPAGSGAPQQALEFYQEPWFPWLVGGTVLTLATGLAIVFWPTKSE